VETITVHSCTAAHRPTTARHQSGHLHPNSTAQPWLQHTVAAQATLHTQPCLPLLNPPSTTAPPPTTNTVRQGIPSPPPPHTHTDCVILLLQLLLLLLQRLCFLKRIC
jgi:hypothetical protein